MKLYDYQNEAVEKLHNGCILCGDVGSGKSKTALAYFFIKECGGRIGVDGDYIPMKDPKDLYIITTARKRDTFEWEEECSSFLLSSNPDNNPYDTKVVIDSWNNIKKYKDVKDGFFIFDEQRVVGSGAWVKSFLKIVKFNHWILLSATPGDTWSDYIPVFIANGFYKNRSEFLRLHAVYSYYSKYPKIERYIGEGKLLKLRKSILVNMRYKRSTVRHNEVILAEYDPILYKTVSTKRWNIYEDSPIENVSELGYTIRRLVNSDESRIKAVEELSLEHKRLIIFYNFDYELALLKNASYPNGTEVKEWNGHKHEPIPASPRWVYLVQYTAGAEGWNCTETDTIIFFSQNYSYKTMIQASGRIDRLNTPYTDLYYYHIRSQSPIDLAISRTLKRKKNFNEKQFFEDGDSQKKHRL